MFKDGISVSSSRVSHSGVEPGSLSSEASVLPLGHLLTASIELCDENEVHQANLQIKIDGTLYQKIQICLH